MASIHDDELPLPLARRVISSGDLPQWNLLALDEQYQAPGECSFANGQAEHMVVVQLRDMPRCQQR